MQLFVSILCNYNLNWEGWIITYGNLMECIIVVV